MDNDTRDGHCEDSPEIQAAANDRRKDKWRTSSSKLLIHDLIVGNI